MVACLCFIQFFLVVSPALCLLCSLASAICAAVTKGKGERRLVYESPERMARGNQRDRDRLKAQAKDAKKGGKNSKDGDPRARAER